MNSCMFSGLKHEIGSWRSSKIVNRIVSGLTWASFGLASLAVQAQDGSVRPSYWHYGWDWAWGHTMFGPLMILMMLLFWGGVIVLIVLAVRWLGRDSGDQSASPAGKTALDILKDRFARGEINKAEFEERKKLLSD